MGALWYLGQLLYLEACRLPYPFELEWLEGAMVNMTGRVLAGKKLYLAPSLEFTPLAYPPLYFYLAAGAAQIGGSGFLPLRLVSLIFSLAGLGLIFLFVYRETGNRFAGGLAAGLFAATFPLSGAWLDLARVDSLFLFLLLAGLYFIRFGQSVSADLLAACWLSLAFLTKQTALVISLPLILYYLQVKLFMTGHSSPPHDENRLLHPRKAGLHIVYFHGKLFMTGHSSPSHDENRLLHPRKAGFHVVHFHGKRKRAVIFVGGLAVLAGGSALLLNYLHGGWYFYYLFHLPGLRWRSLFLESRMLGFWKDVAPLPVVLGLTGWYLASPSASKNRRFYLLAAVGMVGGSWLARLEDGGYLNNLLPAYAMLSILFGLSVNALKERLATLPGKTQTLAESAVYLLCLGQFFLLGYDHRPLIPSAADLKAARQFVRKIKPIKGEILIPAHPYLTEQAGKRSSAHELAVNDVLRDRGPVGRRLLEEIKQAVRQRRFTAIILDTGWFQHFIETYYIKSALSFKNEGEFRPKSGYPARPGFIYFPSHEFNFE